MNQRRRAASVHPYDHVAAVTAVTTRRPDIAIRFTAVTPRKKSLRLGDGSHTATVPDEEAATPNAPAAGRHDAIRGAMQEEQRNSAVWGAIEAYRKRSKRHCRAAHEVRRLTNDAECHCPAQRDAAHENPIRVHQTLLRKSCDEGTQEANIIGSVVRDPIGTAPPVIPATRAAR
jgi:hypothetical protein